MHDARTMSLMAAENVGGNYGMGVNSPLWSGGRNFCSVCAVTVVIYPICLQRLHTLFNYKTFYLFDVGLSFAS